MILRLSVAAPGLGTFRNYGPLELRLSGPFLFHPNSVFVGEHPLTCTLTFDTGSRANPGIQEMSSAVRKITLSWKGASALQPAIIGKPYWAALPAVTSGGYGQVIYTVAKLPTWLHYSVATGLLSGIPPNAALGDIRIKATAADADGSITGVFVLAVTDPSARFGHVDTDGTWIGRPEEVRTDEVVLDHLKPKDSHRVNQSACWLSFYFSLGRATGYSADHQEHLAGLKADYTIDLRTPIYAYDY